ncbi:MAG: metal-dependent phosphohydrolase [Treponema sp.]|nr:metal-dependent phosphohydrolase [Treponema sp.]
MFIESGIPLSRALSLPDGNINPVYLDIMLDEDLPILHINRTKHLHSLTPFKPLYSKEPSFWQKNGLEEYFMTGYGLERLKELAIAKTGSWNITASEEEIIEDEDNEQKGANFGFEYDAIAHMPVEKKIERLNQNKIQLNELIIKKSKDRIAIAKTLASTTSDAAMINHSVLQEIINFADEQAKAYSREMVIQTNEIIKTSTRLLSDNLLSDELLRTITEKSNGIVFQHITRVYLNGTAFLAYFNNKLSSSSTLMKIRTSFNLKYRKFYQALLPHVDSYDMTVDHVFLDGLKIIPSDLFFKWSIGFLVHDLGKAAEIEYHEGAASYDRSKVVGHVKVGYNSIIRKTNYPREAALIAGYHHEYYGDGDGYGPYREDLQVYKSRFTNMKQDYCISYEMEPILAFRTLAYFPAKVLEIIDVYDSLTDSRAYRASMSSEEALDLMFREFIIQRRKIDPILFDIFTAFIRDKELAASKK